MYFIAFLIDKCNDDYSYYCESDRQCIQGGRWTRCDGYKQCPSGDDEAGCRKNKKIN